MNVADARAQIVGLQKALNAAYFERADFVRGLITAAIAEQHLLVLGPPGTAKSELVVAFSEALGWSRFVRLMHKSTEPNELFGPWDLLALKAGRYERLLDGFLPTAEIVFLDEIFKSNSAILNALLTVVNERKFDNGTRRVDSPLRMLIGASNEGPQDDSLGALYDRFLVRMDVAPIQGVDAFNALLDDETDHAIPRLTPGAMDALVAARKEVSLAKVRPLVAQLWMELDRNLGIRPSDRRYRAALKLIRASAVLGGRSSATASDLSMLAHVLWERSEDRPQIVDLLLRLRSPAMTQIVKLRDAAREKMAGLGDLAKLTFKKSAEMGQAQLDLDRISKEIAAAWPELDEDDTEEARGIFRDVQAQCKLLSQTMSRILLAGSSI